MAMPTHPDLDNLSCAAARELDRRAIADYGHPSLLLMEHASIGAARLALRLLAELGAGSDDASVEIYCGPGNNGGDGFAVARHLHNARVAVRVVELCPHDTYRAGSDAALQRSMLERLPIERTREFADELPSDRRRTPTLIIDAIFGTGLARAPTGVFERAIHGIIRAATPVLAIDVPSGLDADRGEPLGCAVEADHTVTFGLPKQGFFRPGARRYVGALYLAPIGVAIELLPPGIPAFPPDPVRWPSP
ncbi:MAG: NAD(P)H-hydrate epimerase [Planctomycetota bacterium]